MQMTFHIILLKENKLKTIFKWYFKNNKLFKNLKIREYTDYFYQIQSLVNFRMVSALKINKIKL